MSLPTTRTAIANLALRKLGDQTVIKNVDDTTADDKATIAMLDVYDQTLHSLISNFPWSFACSLVTLVKVADNPDNSWGVAYLYPTQAVAIWSFDPNSRLLDQQTTPSRKVMTKDAGTPVSVTAVTKGTICMVTAAGHTLDNGDLVKFASIGGMVQLNGNTYIVADSDQTDGIFNLKDLSTGLYTNSTAFTTYTTGGTVAEIASRIILTDIQETQCWITRFVTDVTLYTDNFIDAFSWALAVAVGPVMCGIDRLNIVNALKPERDKAIKQAMANDLIEQKPDFIARGRYAAARLHGGTFPNPENLTSWLQ